MAYQTQSNGSVAYKVQSGLGSAASGSGGTRVRLTGGSGLQASRAQTQSQEVRLDGMSTIGRLGTQKVNGQWNMEASLGSFESILEAIMRDTWDASALSLTQANFTSLAISSNVITLGSGDPRTLGLRVGDVIRLTGMTQSANNSKNLRITGLTATTITIASADTLTNEGADTTCTITRVKKLMMNGTPTKRYFTIDEYDADIDLSESASDFMFGSMKFSWQTNGLLMLDVAGVGTGQFTAGSTGTSPLLTSPTLTTTLPLSVVDATMRIKGADVVDLTSFDLSLDIQPVAPDVFGSGAIKYAPDVFPGSLMMGINFSALRTDLTRITDFLAETPYSIHLLCCENDTEPKDFFSIYIGNQTLGQVQKSALSKQGGPRTQSISIPPALIGIDSTGTGYDATMCKFQSTGV